MKNRFFSSSSSREEKKPERVKVQTNADVSLLDFYSRALIIVCWMMIIRARERDRERESRSRWMMMMMVFSAFPLGDFVIFDFEIFFDGKKADFSLLFSSMKIYLCSLLFRINTCRLYRCLIIYSLFIYHHRTSD